MARSHAPAARRDVATKAPSRRWTLSGRTLRIAFLAVVVVVVFPVLLGIVMASSKNASQQIEQGNGSQNFGSNPNSGVVLPVPISTSTNTPEPTATPTQAPWPIVQVEWTPVADLSILPPAEQGFYNGTMQNESYGSSGTTEWAAYAREILPELLSPFPGAKQGASIARDAMDKKVVLAGLALALPPTGDPSARLFLSVDGEKTWREIQLYPGIARLDGGPEGPGIVILPWSVRVVSHNESLTFFLLAGGGGDGRWYQATLPQ